MVWGRQEAGPTGLGCLPRCCGNARTPHTSGWCYQLVRVSLVFDGCGHDGWGLSCYLVLAI